MTAGNHEDFSVLPATVHSILHEEHEKLDADSEVFLKVLKQSSAPEIWHKHGHFYSHLHDVWTMLCNWNQEKHACRLGLFHSAYSNSFVHMNLFDPDTEKGRTDLRNLIGAKAEILVWKFCVINRLSMEDEALKKMKIPSEGITFNHIRTKEPVHCSAQEIALFLLETVADYQDQSFGWQSDMEAGAHQALWPGIFKPTLRMAKVSQMAFVAREYLDIVPPIFDKCTKILKPEDELLARNLYWSVISSDPKNPLDPVEALHALNAASEHNPYVAEPHTIRAQILIQEGRFEESSEACKRALRIFYDWGTQWDNRMSFAAWIAWTRCILLESSYKQWPNCHGGIESLGAVDPSQKYRKLNNNRYESD